MVIESSWLRDEELTEIAHQGYHNLSDKAGNGDVLMLFSPSGVS